MSVVATVVHEELDSQDRSYPSKGTRSCMTRGQAVQVGLIETSESDGAEFIAYRVLITNQGLRGEGRNRELACSD